MKRTTIFLAALLAVGLCGLAGASSHLTIGPGTDKLFTPPHAGSFFDVFVFLDPIPLQGLPIAPGGTDTIVQRKGTAVLPVDGSSDTIPIEIVALSLVSTHPIELGPLSFFDVFVTLDLNIPSQGQMIITRNSPTGGRFDSFFDVFVEITLDPILPGPNQTIPMHFKLTSDDTPWSNSGDPNGFRIDGTFDGQLWDDQMQNVVGRHVARPIPEPGTLLLLGSGLAGLIRLGKKRK